MNRPTPLRTLAVMMSLCAVFSYSYRTFAQADPVPATQPAETKGTYRSDADDLLTIQTVSVMPFTDNLQGIYARPLEAHLISLVDKMHRWDYVPASSTGPIVSPEELEASVERTKQVSVGLNADAFFVVRATKGPNGVTIHLSLFLRKDGKLLSQAILKDYKQSDITSLKEQVGRLLNEVVTRLPYAGRVLSRESNRVTVNLGARDGIQTNQVLNVVQIINAQRHPKFNFLVKTEREIFGKIKILKVDETLSFGMVISERDKGSIQKNSKVGSIEFVTYGTPSSLSILPSDEEGLSQRNDGGIAFGKDAKPWLPQSPASFGQIGGMLSMGQSVFNRNSTAVGAAEGHDNMTFGMSLLGELWVTQEWTFHARLKTALMPISNPKSNSTPSELNQTMKYYEAGVGYTFRFGSHISSPNVEPYLGLYYYNLDTDDSTPRVYTDLTLSGMKLGVRGSTPVGDGGRFGVGGDFSMAWKPGVREAPAPSGESAKGNVTQFGIFGYMRAGERVKYQAALDFEMFAASFSGETGPNPATSVSHRHTTLSGGVIYMF